MSFRRTGSGEGAKMFVVEAKNRKLRRNYKGENRTTAPPSLPLFLEVGKELSDGKGI